MAGLLLGIGRGALGVLLGLAVLLVVGMIWERWSEVRDARRNAPPGRLVDIGGGRRLHILCKGAAAGPTVVLEMGAGEPSAYWWGVQDRVSAFARVCSYDRAGYMWSDPVKGPRAMTARPADLHALLAAAGVPGPYVLVGHSYGGPLARLYARDYPGETAGLVLVDTPDEGAVFRPSYLAVAGGKMLPVLRGLEWATRVGALRLWGLLFPGRTLTDDTLPPAALKAVAATRSPNLAIAARDDINSLLTASAALRAPGGFGGSLGDRPLAVITHGIPFPPPFDVLDEDWAGSLKRQTALSNDSILITAEHSNHMINIDEPEVIVDAIRRVHAAARDGTRLSPAA